MPLSELGPYRLVRLLSAGGEGSVYIAEDRRLGRRVAVKLYPLEQDMRQRRRMLERARQLVALSHPGIVQLYDLLELPDSLALVLEYVEGNDLEQLLGVAELDVSTVLQLGQDLCTALAAAHAQGIVHGDLKPANVLIQHDGTLKLTDFSHGVSASALSPEQLAGEAPGPASDMFALGCLLYRLLAGVHPFDGHLAASDGPPSSLTEYGVAPMLDSLVAELLNPDPQQRPSAALDVRQRLLSIARDFPAGRGLALADLPESQDDPALAAKLALDDVGAASARRTRTGLVAGLGIVLLVAFGVWLLRPVASAPVTVALPEVEGVSTVSAPQLASILREAVQRSPHTHTSTDAVAENLLLRVTCNEYLCTSQLIRSGESELADTRSLLPDADSTAWRHRLEQGVRELYAR